MKTTNLHLPRRWYDLSTPVCAALCIVLLLLIGLVIGRVRSGPSAAVPTPALAYVYIATPIPDVPPAVQRPTPDAHVYVELAALRQRLDELEAQQAAAPDPQVVYVNAAPAPAPCQSAGIPGKMIEVCGDGDLSEAAKQKWIVTYGGTTP